MSKQKITLVVLLAVMILNGAFLFQSDQIKTNNPYLKGIISSIKNGGFIEATAQYGGGAVTVAVEPNTSNRLPNITGTCTIGSNMVFTIKKGNSGIVSETINKLCDVSPYALTPTILLPNGKYRVNVKIN
jgi:hypothetical protein